MVTNNNTQGGNTLKVALPPAKIVADCGGVTMMAGSTRTAATALVCAPAALETTTS